MANRIGWNGPGEGGLRIVSTAVLGFVLLGAPLGCALDRMDGAEARPARPSVGSLDVTEKQILFIRVDFSDLPGDPISEAAAIDLVDVQVGQFYADTSYNQVTLRTTVTPTYRMPQPTSYYVPAGGPYSPGEMAARNDYDLSQYDYYIVASKYVSGYWTRGGGQMISLPGAFHWLAVAHELGHCFGLGHARYLRPKTTYPGGPAIQEEYGSPYDIMGRGNDQRAQFGARSRDTLGWLAPSEVQEVSASGVFQIFALETPITVGLHALRIPTGSMGREYWVEFRNAWWPDPRLDGVIITENFSDALLDATPLSAATMDDAALRVGRTFADPANNVYVTATRRGGGTGGTPAYIEVVVKRGTFAKNHPPQVTVSATALEVPINTSVWFTALASDPNGDETALSWSFGDGTANGGSDLVGKRWSTAGEYVVRVQATDMKGATGSAYVVVRVGSPSTYRVEGNILDSTGQPVESAFVAVFPAALPFDWTYPWSTWTDSAGNYSITNVAEGSYYVVPSRWNREINPGGFTSPDRMYVVRSAPLVSPVSVGASEPTAHADFVAAPYYATPAAPVGPETLTVGQNGTYSIAIVVPSVNPLGMGFLEVDWGDGASFLGFESTNEASHAWSAVGTYEVRVTAYDGFGARSAWSPALLVTVE